MRRREKKKKKRKEEFSVHFSFSVVFSLCHPPLPSSLTWALPLAERWDSFTEAAGCQDRASLRKAGRMYVGQCESEGGFSFSFNPPPPLLFPNPPFLSLFVPLFFFFLFFLALLLAPFTPLSEKITLICVCPVYYSPGLVA